MKLIFKIFVLLIFIFIIFSCSSTYFFRSNYKNHNALLHNTKDDDVKPFLKAHLKNGDICIYRDTWKIDTLNNIVNGFGTRYDFNRLMISEDSIKVNLDSVVIYETNRKLTKTENYRIGAITIITAMNLATTMYCVINPKACFGSCPTFYVNSEQEKDDIENIHSVDAEGFSSAIAPSFEYGDIDALSYHNVKDNQFSLTMKNEAFETHCIKSLKLKSYPLKENERVYQTKDDRFYLCENNYKIDNINDEFGDLDKTLINEIDDKEWFSYADEDNLSSKEEIILKFNTKDRKESNNLGLLINYRQTLMTTFFIYNAMSYMGDEVSDIFAKIENDEELRSKINKGIKSELGGIDIYLFDEINKKWTFQNSLYETGPIAKNLQIVQLNNNKKGNYTKIKLVLNRGSWRLDYISLTDIKKKVIPTEIKPKFVFKIEDEKNIEDYEELSLINSPNEYLLSMPGDEYKISFEIPAQDNVAKNKYELFLYSEGYYWEWMRGEWLKDKDLLKLRDLVENPADYLKNEAKAYKKYEKTMEEAFWESRINTKSYSYYE